MTSKLKETNRWAHNGAFYTTEREALLHALAGDENAPTEEGNQKYWALGEDGLLYYIGLYENYEEADIGAENMKVKAIWLVDQETANSWRDTLIDNEETV